MPQPLKPLAGEPLARRLRALRDEDSGAAILEFALLLPILVVLVYGCFEVGRALLVRQAMEGAVRAGARILAQVPDAACEAGCPPGAARAVRITESQILANTGLPPGAVTAEPQPDPPAGTVAMQASVAFDVMFPGPVPLRRWTLKARHQEPHVGQ
ncbi:TadE/TadG family type IV pilus assembly protein [Methylobacterium sp. J-090]|uniref:TadE/TadG family type IV pilus assembly protein n=1 Tax=Methylobacterium sp. J-090 TaxID=2836666 RepID=UPI001FBA61BC|nr:TadE/TadG family type IV pilus assembly protein [Methylobacterium sp. J-090]MCJ2082590.1 pilus assembly protein [Methylobacterium sp. J-090]